jgi:mRNA-degrading endonuclease RelE of RelBE toxin-antitoxin system
MEVRISEKAEKDLDGMDASARKLFIRHIEKISGMPPRRHRRFGLPFNVEEVGQGRIVYSVEKDSVNILRCFTAHKEYEKWYLSFR